MDSSALTMVERLPLDQIRQTEAEIARRIAVAEQAAEAALKEARAQAADLKRQAHETGRREGQTQYKEIASRAEKRAHALVEQARNQAEDLRYKGNRCMDVAVRRAVEMVIGQKEKADDA